MVEHVKLKVTVNEYYEWLINEDTNEVILEGQVPLATEDILWALGYKFAIEMDFSEE